MLQGMMRNIIERDMMMNITGVTNTVADAADNVLTIDKFRAAMRDLPGLMPPRPQMLLVYSTIALKETTERLFPRSKHRSRRILKKLLKRHGGEFRRQPAMWRIGNTIYAHPSFRSQLEALTRRPTQDDFDTGIGNRPYFGAPNGLWLTPTGNI